MKYTTTMLERGSIESNKITAAVKTLDTLLKWSGRYDNKLSVFAAIDIGMLGAMFIAIHPLISLILKFMFFLTLILLGFSLIEILLGSFPRTASPNKSLIFFGTIAKMDQDYFKKAFKNLSDEDYIDDILSQCHRNSQILSVKFLHFRIAVLLGMMAIIPWLLSFFLL